MKMKNRNSPHRCGVETFTYFGHFNRCIALAWLCLLWQCSGLALLGSACVAKHEITFSLVERTECRFDWFRHKTHLFSGLTFSRVDEDAAIGDDNLTSFVRHIGNDIVSLMFRCATTRLKWNSFPCRPPNYYCYYTAYPMCLSFTIHIHTLVVHMPAASRANTLRIHTRPSHVF